MIKRFPQQNPVRSNTGGMLALTLAMFLGIVMSILLFSLAFTRFIGSHQQQITAIDAAVLAAASDLSIIVIDDPNFGFISLSDAPPIGKGTSAGDNYYLPVTGINTLLATVRLDMIIADQLDDQLMAELAKRDYKNALKAKDNLIVALKAAIQSGGSGKDKDGNLVSPVQDATDAYVKNKVRMSQGQSKLLPGSLKLSLGCVDDLPTNVRIPQPAKFACMTTDQQDQGFYKAYVNAPYNNNDFVFAATCDAVELVDAKKFKESLDGLPYFIPAIVRCEADQEYTNAEGKGDTKIVHAVSCAQTASLIDKCPHPGAFMVSFPTGVALGVDDLYSLLTNTSIATNPTDYTMTPTQGDFADTPLSVYAIPTLTTPYPPFGQLLRVSLYDWIRRGRANVNVQALIDGLKISFAKQTNAYADLYEFDAQGIVQHTTEPISNLLLPVSNKQFCAISGLSMAKSGTMQLYDISVKDYVYQPGRTTGGLHGGEPLGEPQPPKAAGASLMPDIFENPSQVQEFPRGSGNGEVRPTYLKTGTAVEIRFKLRAS